MAAISLEPSLDVERQLCSDLGRSAPLIAFTVTGSFRSSGREPGHSFSNRSASWSRRSLQLTGAGSKCSSSAK